MLARLRRFTLAEPTSASAANSNEPFALPRVGFPALIQRQPTADRCEPRMYRPPVGGSTEIESDRPFASVRRRSQSPALRKGAGAFYVETCLVGER